MMNVLSRFLLRGNVPAPKVVLERCCLPIAAPPAEEIYRSRLLVRRGVRSSQLFRCAPFHRRAAEIWLACPVVNGILPITALWVTA